MVSSNGGIENDDAVAVALAHVIEQCDHGIAGQQFRRTRVRKARWQQREIIYIGAQQYVRQADLVVQQQVQQAGCRGRPSVFMMDWRATSASTSITVWFSSIARLMARLIAVKVLPSPGNELVTMMRLPLATSEAPLPVAFSSSGRLMTRNWSVVAERGALGVTNPAAANAVKSMCTLLEPGGETGTPRGTSMTTSSAGENLADCCSALGAGISSCRTTLPGTGTPAFRNCSSRCAFQWNLS